MGLNRQIWSHDKVPDWLIWGALPNDVRIKLCDWLVIIS